MIDVYDEREDRLVEIQLVCRNMRFWYTLKEKGLTLERLAKLTDISIPTLRRILTLRGIPSQETKEKLAHVLEKPVDFLFPLELSVAIEGDVFDSRHIWLDSEILSFLTSAKGLKRLRRLLSAIFGEELELENIDSFFEKFRSAKAKLRELLDGIDPRFLMPREKEFLKWRFGLEEGRPMNYEQIGRRWGTTRERVRSIEKRILRKLRNLKRRGIVSFDLGMD